MRWQLQRPGTSRVEASDAEGVVFHEEPMEITIAVGLGVAVAIMAAMSASHVANGPGGGGYAVAVGLWESSQDPRHPVANG